MIVSQHRMKSRRFRRANACWLLLAAAASVTSVGCAGIIGADFDREQRPSEDAGELLDANIDQAVDDASSEPKPESSTQDANDAAPDSLDGSTSDRDDAAVQVDGPTDSPEDGGPLPSDPPVCGEMSGLQAGSPWPMENYCPTRPSRSPHPFAKGRRLRWSTTFDERVATSPVIAADGTIYVGTVKDGAGGATHMRAVSSSGDKVWSFPTVQAGYPTSSAAIGSDGTVYFGDLTTIYAVHPTGTEKWSKDIGMFATSITIGAAGRLYAGTHAGKVIAVDLATGTVPWSLKPPGVAVGPVSLGLDGNLYVTGIGGLGGYLHSINSDGTLLWSADLGGNMASDSYGPLPASIGANGLLYVVESLGTEPVLRAFRPDKSQAFELAIGGHAPPLGSPVIAGEGTIFSLQAHTALALDASGGVLWSKEYSSTFMSPAVGSLHNEVCAGGIAMGDAGFTTQLVCLGANGSPTQSFDSMLPFTGANTRFGTAAIGADGTIYVGLDTQLMAIGD